MALKTLIEAEMKVLKAHLNSKRKQGSKKHIGALPSMKHGKLCAEAKAIVLARLAGGGIASSSSSSINALPSAASSPPSSSSIVSCSSASPSSVSPASSTASSLPVLGVKFLSGLIPPDASYRGKKMVKYATLLFAEAPELWEKYSATAGASVPFKSAVNTQRRAVYDFMCKSIEALAPDFIDRVGIPTSEAELMTSAKSWVAFLASIPADTAPPPPPPQTSAPTAAVVPPSTTTAEPPSTQAADVESQQLVQAQMARQIAVLQAQLAISQAEALKQAQLREEEKAQMFQREQMIAMAFQQQAAAAAAKAFLTAATASSSGVVPVAEPRLDSGSTRAVKRLKTDSGSAPRPRPRGNAPFTALSARYKQRVVLESSKAVTDRVGASADGRVAVAAQLVKSPTSFNLLLKLRRNQQ